MGLVCLRIRPEASTHTLRLAFLACQGPEGAETCPGLKSPKALLALQVLRNPKPPPPGISIAVPGARAVATGSLSTGGRGPASPLTLTLCR